MGRRMSGLRAWMMDYAYLVTLGAVIAVIAGCALYTQQVKRRTADVQAAAPAPEVMASPSPGIGATDTPLPTPVPLAVRTMQPMTAGGLWPVEGEVLRGFDEQAFVFWESLSSWRTHPALDIAGRAGQAVACCADGMVERSTWDELWGWRVTVAQEDGWQVSYCGLESSLVAAGDPVTRGRTLGTLLERIPCEGEMPAHLHLEAHKNGAIQDPEAMLGEKASALSPLR